jgi:hypothetical protein
MKVEILTDHLYLLSTYPHVISKEMLLVNTGGQSRRK